jgi:hypothetical protein
MQRLNSQIMHLGKRRPSEAERKFSTEDAGKILGWVEQEKPRFLKALSPEARAHWNEDRSDPAKQQLQSISCRPGGPYTTTNIIGTPIFWATGPGRPQQPVSPEEKLEWEDNNS